MRKGDLISRSDIMMYLDKRKTYEMMDGRNKAYGKGVRDAMKDIESAPAVEAVPPVEMFPVILVMRRVEVDC